MLSGNVALKDFVSRYPLRSYKPSHTLVYQSEIPRSIYYIQSGKVRIFAIDKNGSESNISFISAGTFLPIEVLFGKSRTSLHYYEAAEKVEVAVIPQHEITAELEKDIQFTNAVLDMVTTQYVGAKIHIQALEHTLAQDKILRILQYLVMRFGVEKKPNIYKIPLKLKQHDIANLIGVTRETAATELGKLKKMKIIDYDSFQYSVDMKALEKLVGNDGWEDVEID